MCWSSGMGIRKSDKQFNYSHRLAQTKQRWLVCNWNTFGARTNHEQTQTHKIDHNPDLGEATTFPFIVLFMPGHKASTQMSFYPGTFKLESRNSWNWNSLLLITTNWRHSLVFRSLPRTSHPKIEQQLIKFFVH